MTKIDPQIYKKGVNANSYAYKESSIEYFLKRGYVVKAKFAFRNRYVHPDWENLAAKQMRACVMLLDKDYVGSFSEVRMLVWKDSGGTYKVTSKTK